jgi:hypothetical protein
MSSENLAALIAAAVSSFGALVAVVVVVSLTRRVRDLQEVVKNLSNETVPLVRDARVVMDQAASEMERVGDVLASAEAVSGTVDSASRLAYRMFANPVVKTLAFSTGAASALRRLFSRRSVDRRNGPDTDRGRESEAPYATVQNVASHRRRRRAREERRASKARAAS